MIHLAVKPLEQAWGKFHALIPSFPIRNEQQYDQAIETINWLLDVVGNDETHPLYDLLDTLGTLIELYEEQHYPVSDVTGVQVLQFFMAEHQLKPSDFPELGGPDRVTALLEGRQELDVRDIRTLSARFGVSSATFV